jgi:hypothetical protein
MLYAALTRQYPQHLPSSKLVLTLQQEPDAPDIDDPAQPVTSLAALEALAARADIVITFLPDLLGTGRLLTHETAQPLLAQVWERYGEEAP